MLASSLLSAGTSVRVFLWILLSFIGLAQLAHAHEIRPGLISVTQLSPGEYDVVWKQPLLGDRRLPLEPVLAPNCAKAGAQVTTTAGALVERWKTTCDLESIHIQGLEGTLTDVLLEYSDTQGEEQRALLRAENPRYELGQNADGSAFLYLQLGVEHLVFGYDHLLFVLALLLLIASTRTLLITVTCFTLAHSITLALSVLGWVQLAQGPIEACIALSSLGLAYEALSGSPSQLSRTPWLAAFAFGLLHGFGFAGALRDIGLPSDNLLVALLAFNVGIELAQIGLIGLWLFSIFLISKTQLSSATAYLRIATAYGIGAMAMFWTLDRVIPIATQAMQS